MSSKKAKRLKKIFVYFLGAYFLIAGVLVSGQTANASITTNACTKDSDCFYGYCDSATKICTPYSPTNCNYDYQCGLPNSGKHCATTTHMCIADAVNNSDVEKLPAPVTTTKPVDFTPQISIPGYYQAGKTVSAGYETTTLSGNQVMVSDLLPNYIGAFYKYALTIIGIIAAVTLMGGGIVWLTSAGNDSKITQAKEMIFGSLIGIGLLFGSFMILNTINPSLVKLDSIKTKLIAPMQISCCQYRNPSSAEMTSVQNCHNNKGIVKDGYTIQNNECVAPECCVEQGVYDNKEKWTLCVDTSPALCALVKGTISSGSKCDQNPICKGNLLTCGAESAEGDYCKKNGTNSGSGYCYGGFCNPGGDVTLLIDLSGYPLGFPCGNRGGSVCRPNNCNGDWSSDNSGGSCERGAWCCNKKGAVF